MPVKKSISFDEILDINVEAGQKIRPARSLVEKAVDLRAKAPVLEQLLTIPFMSTVRESLGVCRRYAF